MGRKKQLATVEPVPSNIVTKQPSSGTIKIDPLIAHKLRVVAEWKGISIATLIRDLLYPFAEEQFRRAGKEISAAAEPEA